MVIRISPLVNEPVQFNPFFIDQIPKRQTAALHLTPEAVRLISHLHPEKKIKGALKTLQQNPYLGDDLQEELSAFKSFKPKRYRILDTVDDENKTLQIYYVDHKRDVYDHFRILFEKLNH